MTVCVWTEEGFVSDDPWITPGTEPAEGSNGRPLLSLDLALARLASDRELDGVGIIVEPCEDVGRLAPYVERIALVAVRFAAFNDGRAFSQAALLRSRYGFTNDMRAVGDVLIDQIPMMLRCGISSVAVSNSVAQKRLSEGRLPGIRHHYQPATRQAARLSGQAGKAYAWRRTG